MKKVKRLETDVLIIGSEAAGGRAAIEAEKHGFKILIITKGLVGKTGVTIQTGLTINAAMGFRDPRDNPNIHFEDTICSGFGINNQKLVEMVTREVPERVMELVSWGAKLDKDADGKFYQCLQPGMRYPRSFYTRRVGKEIVTGINNKLNKLKNITILKDTFITKLLKYDRMIVGATAINLKNGEFIVINAKSTILATGGAMQMFSSTRASLDATGDGYSLAYRAGAELVDMEFFQFYPNNAIEPELWPGRGGDRARGRAPSLPYHRLHTRFYNKQGERFMRRYDPLRMEHSPRAIMACAMAKEIAQGRGTKHGGVWASIAYLPKNVIDQMLETAPWAAGHIRSVEKWTDPRVNAVEIHPVAHYYCGGIRINEKCETSLEGLYAAGEVTGGFDGSNRMPANAISMCLVTGHHAGKSAAERASILKSMPSIEESQVQAEFDRVFGLLNAGEGPRAYKIKIELQDLMEEYAASWRTEEGLTKVIQWITHTREEVIPKLRLRTDTRIFNMEWKHALEICNLLDCSEMLSRAALMRTETRPAHQRGDYQYPDDKNWWKNIIVKLRNGDMHLETKPIVTTRLKTIEEINKLMKYEAEVEAMQPRWWLP
ncbi:MAG: FAD-binding protein [Desulfobacterales bacterium]|nr:FAD-binding protein [Desulfobacterales bacterium]